jgi:hypothetical protein
VVVVLIVVKMVINLSTVPSPEKVDLHQVPVGAAVVSNVVFTKTVIMELKTIARK